MHDMVGNRDTWPLAPWKGLSSRVFIVVVWGFFLTPSSGCKKLHGAGVEWKVLAHK